MPGSQEPEQQSCREDEVMTSDRVGLRRLAVHRMYSKMASKTAAEGHLAASVHGGCDARSRRWELESHVGHRDYLKR